MATTKGHEVTPFLSLDYFTRCPVKIKAKAVKDLMAKKARIRAYPEEEATKIAMADCLGHQGHLGRQKLTKENLAGPSVFLEDH